jgi:hypothetical protein
MERMIDAVCVGTERIWRRNKPREPQQSLSDQTVASFPVDSFYECEPSTAYPAVFSLNVPLFVV